MPKYTLSPEELEKIQSYPWLTQRERTVFRLHYVDGISIEDVAAEIEIHRRTVDRILVKLRSVAKMSHKFR